MKNASFSCASLWILRDLVSRFLLGTLKPPPVFETHFGVALVERLGFRADAQIPVPGFSAKVLSCRPALFRWRLPLPEIFSLRTRRSVQIPAQGSILPPLKRALQRFSFFWFCSSIFCACSPVRRPRFPTHQFRFFVGQPTRTAFFFVVVVSAAEVNVLRVEDGIVLYPSDPRFEGS
jgi:hypothetical protein